MFSLKPIYNLISVHRKTQTSAERDKKRDIEVPVLRMNDKALQSAAFTAGSGFSSNPTHTHLS